MEKTNSSSVSPDIQPTGKITEADLRSKMQDPRYWNPSKRDPAFVKEIEDGFSKLY